ncbi:hypothetical protein CB0940_07570 [Cercospora beticola]|uniref:Yeast cell wall synthesis Kre9/Knh1-like N-terminal domain-containing protein n=1 Tax=Cercospora beticola TaxID=122368 RepID=A0A2G5H868_CERBT|nr:hypothetical protein CB0940_07570 [Cercospora beticola]PIA88725.1 hypothetical protein CB0940_07570 [Cercospora beticola]WPB03531.1 hypothetical protein RHO25_008171 [Cercospora beticola]
MFSKLFLAGLLGLAAAYTKPVGDKPEGNPISQPGLNSVVPVGEGFTVTWEPTTEGTVTLLLLKGPSSNAVPQYPIVEKIENKGTYVWTPSTDLEPTENAQGYGIQLIVDATGQYQYTTQFGISNPGYKKSDKTDETPAGYGGSYSSASSAAKTPDAYTKPVPSTSSVASAYYPIATGSPKPAQNVTMIPGGYTKTSLATYGSTTAPTATASRPAQATGAAANVAISFFGLVAAGGAAIMAV